jgi:predicted regulator of Ras-like GTPase activity (Roadblock/LC7/MglB family)
MASGSVLTDLFIINESGVLIYSSSPGDSSSLISSFLTALNIFAKSEKGETMKELTLEQTTFIFEKRDTLIFVATTTLAGTNGKALIKHVLDRIIETFEAQFSQEIPAFDGNVTPFESYTGTLGGIRIGFGLDIADRAAFSLRDEPARQSIVLLHRRTGDVLLSEAKQYANLEDLAYLVPLVTKAGEHVLEQVLEGTSQASLGWILVVSAKDRAMLVQVRSDVLDAEEFKIQFDFSKGFSQKPKKIKDKLASPAFLPEIKYMSVFSAQGKMLDELSRDPRYSLSVGLDATMLVNAGNSLNQKLYNSKASAIAIGGESRATVIIPIKDAFVVIRGDYGSFKEFATMIGIIKKLMA